MQTRLSSKGQVVLPSAVRQRLGLRTGETLTVAVEEGRVILTRSASVPRRFRMAVDPRTGIPMLSAPEAVAALTNDQVKELLGDFP